MPIYLSPEGRSVFHAHVPGSGGAYIGRIFLANGFTRRYWSDPDRAAPDRVLPQHAVREDFIGFDGYGTCDHRFITVRHPVDRLVRLWRAAGSAPDIGSWLDTAEAALDADLTAFGNRLRPQSDFYDPALAIDRAESPFDSVWARHMASRLGMTWAELNAAGYETPDAADLSGLGDADLDRVIAFARAHHDRDFGIFDYRAEDAAILRAAGRTGPPDLRVTAHKTATIAPVITVPGTRIILGTSTAHARRGGVYAATGEILFRSVYHRDNRKFFHEGRFSPEDHIPGDVLYGGILFRHFGHFILESTARLWAARTLDSDTKIAFSIGSEEHWRYDEPAILGWQRAVFDHLGIANDVLMVERPRSADRVLIPDPGLLVPDRIHPDFLRFLESAGPDHAPEPGVRIWLSRSRIDDGGKTYGMAGLERRLARAGWTILYPEEMTFADQLAALARAERVAGEEGSALHTLIFLRNAHRLRVDILPRFGSLRQTYRTIAEAKGFTQVEHDIGKGLVLKREGPVIRKWHPFLGGVARTLIR